MSKKEVRTIATYNVRLLPDEATLTYWTELLRSTADAYTLCVKLITEAKCELTIKTVHHVCYDTVRKTFPILPAQGAIRAQKEAMAAIRSKHSNKHNGEQPKKHSLSITLDKRMYSRLTNNSIALCGGEKGKRVSIPFVCYNKLSEMFSTHKACDPTLFVRNEQLWLAVPFDVPNRPVIDETCIGVDLGMKRLFVTSDGYAFRDKTYLKNRRKVRYLKRHLRSKGTKSARKHLKRISKKEKNLSRDMQYRAVNALLNSTSASIIVLEDLSKLKSKTKKSSKGFKRKKHNNAIGQVPFSEFKSKLEAKAPLFGKKVETVNPAFTSQVDSRTGNDDGKRKGCRYYCCDCVVLDADWNAAVNIAKKSKHPLSNPCPVDGHLVFLRGRAQSTAQTYVNPHAIAWGITSPLL